MAHPPYDPYYLPPIHPPPPPVPPPPYHHQQQDNGINTLFVSGLPDDVRAREIHNLFRRKPGFDFCQLKYTGRGNQGVKFDPQSGSVLHIELARSNSRKKRKPGSGAYVVIDKRTKTEANVQESSSADGDSDTDEASPVRNIDSADKGDFVTTQSERATDSGNAVAPINEQSEKPYEGGVQPCSTLFIANLGPNCTEDELKQTLSVYPGFNMLKMRARGGMPVAFADFEEVEQASIAMEGLQDSTLPSSDRGGMHIEYLF
ncbi:RNA-binding (RRM/RBD/RNP motifs) family protein [Citrus sinensis]|uniref:RNA-binding (RRM/RBD/RNP motifs) family protein n=1 Tax=Citrus sinensis TaxID=2711 RepID=A0ACB8J6I4_CITSI|nr:RNA-binding (RRM/RBD/RNP motifs) family protein [Citrus sinensis]